MLHPANARVASPARVAADAGRRLAELSRPSGSASAVALIPSARKGLALKAAYDVTRGLGA